jgi:branched-chain amino acid transport system ATP-binding protein
MALKVKNLGVTFGGLKAVVNFNINIKPEEIIGLIGPNGAGKTTIFNLLTGVYHPSEGEIIFNGELLNKKKTYQINNLGIARTFQNIRLFKNISVSDNVKIAYDQNLTYGELAGIFKTKSYAKQEREAHQKTMELLKIFDLDDAANELAGNLPYGRQRKLEIARALASNPTLLLLDEPAAGMNPVETAELAKNISFVKNRFNISILLIEHDMNLIMNICEKIYVLDYGSIIAYGTPDEIKNNKDVISAYLGED